MIGAWQRLRARAADDAGMSLIELMVAMVILAVAFSALLSTFVASFAAITRNEAQVRATALANEVVEQMAASPWARVGIYADDPDVSFDFEGEDMVLIPAESPQDPLVPRAREEIVRDGRTYTVERWITWVEEDGGQDIKRLVTEVSWLVGPNTRSLRSDALRSPTPEELIGLTVEFDEIQNNATEGRNIRLLEDFTNADAISMVLRVSDPTTNDVTVSFRNRSGTLVHILTTMPAGEPTKRTLYISSGSKMFPHGAHSFVVTAVGNDGETASNAERLTFYQDLEVGVPQLTHDDSALDSVCVTPTGEAASPLHVDVHIDGMSGSEAAMDDALLLTWPGADPVPMQLRERTLAGGWFRGTVTGPITGEPEVDTNGDPTGNSTVTFTVTADRMTGDVAFDATDSNAVWEYLRQQESGQC